MRPLRIWRNSDIKYISCILCLLDRASLWYLKNKRPTWCHLLFYFTSYVLNMFRTLIYPSSSGACDCAVELAHWSYCSWLDVCWSFGVVGLEWNRTKNNTTNVIIQQNSRKLLMMDILMSETFWAHKKWNKIASDIKLVFYSSTIFLISAAEWLTCPCLSIGQCITGCLVSEILVPPFWLKTSGTGCPVTWRPILEKRENPHKIYFVRKHIFPQIIIVIILLIII